MSTTEFTHSLPRVVLGSGVHDYPEHRRKLLAECFFSGLAPVLVPPQLIPSPESAQCFQQLLASSEAYLGFLAHHYWPRNRPREGASIYEEEWRLAVEKARPRLFFLADYSAHFIDPALVAADLGGLSKVVELAREVETSEPHLCRFTSAAGLSEELPRWLARLRSDLGLPAVRFLSPKTARSEVFVSYAHEDDRYGHQWLKLIGPSFKRLQNGAEKIPFWIDDRIEKGELWEEQIYRHIDNARVAVLLVSRNYFDSDFIAKKELPRILAAAEKGELKVLPVLLEDCHHPELDRYQFVGPSRERDLVSLQILEEFERNLFWKELETAIRKAFQSWSAPKEGMDFPQMATDALSHLCEADPMARAFGLKAMRELFFVNERTPAGAWPYLEWAREELAWLARDLDRGFSQEANDLLRRLPVRIPEVLTTPEVGIEAAEPGPEQAEALARYVDWVERTHKWLELPGIREIAAIPRIELDRVFVALRGDRATAHERLQSKRLLDLEVLQYARSLDQDPATLDLPSLRRKLLLVDEFMPLHREVVRQSSSGAQTEQSISLGEAFRRDRWLVILGEPGSGKTTLIRWLALQLAAGLGDPEQTVKVECRKVDPNQPDETSQVHLGPARLPIIVRVSNYAEAKALHGQDYALHQYLGYHPWQGQQIPPSLLPPAQLNQLILDYLRAGKAVVLLDGMDEIAQSELRDVIRTDINQFIEQWINGRGDPQWIGRPDAYLIEGEPWSTGGNQIVITSRIVGYHVAPLHGPLTHVIIEPMTEPAVRNFCLVWSRAVNEAAHPGIRSAEHEAAAEAEGKGLQTAVFDPDRSRIRELASNPLLITILALIYRRHGGRLPDQRVELYRKAIEVLIDDWPEGAINRSELRAVLPDVAELIHRTTSTGLIEPGNLKQVLAESLTETRRADGRLRADQSVRADSDDIQEFLDVVLRRVGLLAGRGDLLLGFVHLTFQEYLAALWLVRDQDVSLAASRILGLLDNPRWREPILLALGHAGSQIGWPDEKFVLLLRRLIEADAAVGEVLPRIVLMLARALEELPRVPDDMVKEMARQLLRVLAAQSGALGVGPLRDEIDEALAHLRRQKPPVVEGVLIEALGQSSSSATVAALLRRREWLEPVFAESLLDALIRGLDQEGYGWPILMALRDFATPPLPMAPPSPPSQPMAPKVLEQWSELVAAREVIATGARLAEVVQRIDRSIRALPQEVAAAGPDNPASPVRELQLLHEERIRLESGEALRDLEQRLEALRASYEEAAKAHSEEIRGYEERLEKHQAALTQYQLDLASTLPRGKWPAGSLPLQQWLRDDPRRHEVASRSPQWLPVFIALYGGVRDYRVGRFEVPYQKAVEAFHEFDYTYKATQADAIYQRAVALDNWQPQPRRWRADLPFEFMPEFIFRHSPLHAELISRFEREEPPGGGGWLEGLAEHSVREVRVEALLARFAAGEEVQPFLTLAWKSAEPETRETAAATLHALKGLLAGWQETLEYLLPKLIPRMLAPLNKLAMPAADSLRELLLAATLQIEDPARRATSLWRLLPSLPEPLVPEVWAAALAATWETARHLGYDDPVYDCAVILQEVEGPAAAELTRRFSQQGFNRLFAEALCPGWAEHPDLVAEALHEYFATVPERFDDIFQTRLLQGKESLPDICAVWFSIRQRYEFAVILDASGKEVPNSEEGFLAYALKQIGTLPVGRQARTMLRLARYLPVRFRQSRVDRAAILAEAVSDTVEKLATYQTILQEMPTGPDQTALANRAARLVSSLPIGRARVYSLLTLLPLVSADRQPKLQQRILKEIGQIRSPASRAAILRQAGRWARATVQIETLIEAAATLLDADQRRWVSGRLASDLPELYRRASDTIACSPDEWAAWSLALLAGRAEDLLADFEQSQDPHPWTLLASHEEVALGRLLSAGEKLGLPLTIEATEAIDWMLTNQREDLLKLILPLIDRPVREAWPRVQRWLDDPSRVVAQHAALLVAEHGRQITAQTFPHLLALTEGDLDRSRLRAAIILHGRVVDTNNEERVLLSRLGAETMDLIGEALHTRRPDRLAPNLLTPSISAGRQRSSAKILAWIEHQIVFDDSEMVLEYFDRSAESDPVATAIFLRLEACSGSVLRLLIERLSLDQTAETAIHFLMLLSQLLNCRTMSYPMRPESEDWDALTSSIPAWFARLPKSVLREVVLIGDTDELVTAFIESARSPANGPAPRDLSRIVRGCKSVLGPLGEMEAAKSADHYLQVLELLGMRRYYRTAEDSRAAFAAAERLRETPEVFPLLMEWLEILLREDLNDRPIAKIRLALLEVIAAHAVQHPSTVAAQALDMGLLPLLCRVVTFSEHFRSRANAVLLLGVMRRLNKEAAISLLSALRDVFDVQNAALQAIDKFRYIDGEALELLLAEIRPENDSATAICGAARLLAGLAASESLTASQRKDVLERLSAILRNRDVSRRGVYFMTGSGGKDDNEFRVRFDGRLGEVLYDALLRMAGGTLQVRLPAKIG
jgi:hypothetical protein